MQGQAIQKDKYDLIIELLSDVFDAQFEFSPRIESPENDGLQYRILFVQALWIPSEMRALYFRVWCDILERDWSQQLLRLMLDIGYEKSHLSKERK